MRRFSAFFLMFALLPGLARAQQPEVRRHTVVRGETLWGLAERYCGDPFRWPEIHQANRAMVQDPDLILPEQVFAIPCAEPVREPPAAEPIQVREGVEEPADSDVAYSERDRPSIFRREIGVRARTVEPEPMAVMSRDASWSAPWLQPAADDTEPGEVSQLLAGESTRTAMPYQRVRVTTGMQVSLGDVFQIVRPARPVRGVGMVMIPTGMASVVQVGPTGFDGVLLKSYGRVSAGDLVFPAPAFDVQADDRAQPISDRSTARIVAFGDPHELQQLGDVALLDRGADDGVAVGDEYVLMIDGEGGWEPRVAGRLQVVRVTPSHASARLVRIMEPEFRAGVEVRLDRKMR